MVRNQAALGRRFYEICSSMVELVGFHHDLPVLVHNISEVRTIEEVEI